MRTGLPAIMALIGFCCLGLTAAAGTATQVDATDALRRALAAEERRLGPASPALLPTLRQLALARWRDGDFAETTSLQRRALDIAVRAFGSGSPGAAEAMTALAQTDIDCRRYLDAEPLLIAAANVLTDSAARDQATLTTVFAALARVAVARGSADDGETWAQRAVAAAAKNPRQGATDALFSLASVRAAQERFAESEQLVRDALSRDRERSGPNGNATAHGLAQLGNLFLRQQRYEEALPPLEQAAQIDRQALAPTHPFIADDFYDLALAYDGLKRPDEARKSLAFAVKLLEHGTGKDSLRLAYAEREFAQMLRAAGKEKEADIVAADSKRILDKAEDEERERERQI